MTATLSSLLEQATQPGVVCELAPGGGGCGDAPFVQIDTPAGRSLSCPAHAAVVLRAVAGAAVVVPGRALGEEACDNCWGTGVMGAHTTDGRLTPGPDVVAGRATLCLCSWDFTSDLLAAAHVLDGKDWQTFCLVRGINPEAYCAGKGVRDRRRVRRLVGTTDVDLSPAVAE